MDKKLFEELLKIVDAKKAEKSKVDQPEVKPAKTRGKSQ